ncbi:hypothetical protein ABGB08_51155 [Acrocarpospora sp. B8E8]
MAAGRPCGPPPSPPSMGILGPAVGNVVGAAHLLIGCTTLGLIIAFRPEFVRTEK